MTRLADLTTFRIGGPAGSYLALETREAVIEALTGEDPGVLIVAGGSNLLIGDAGWPGTVAHVRSTGIEVSEDADATRVTVQAGEVWDALVARTVDAGLSGLEALSGIPGSVGATPIQNVGAYGTEVSHTIEAVEVLDRASGAVSWIDGADCGFGYRDSRFKRAARAAGHPVQVVLAVRFALQRDALSAPVRYAELARALDVEAGERAPAMAVREEVLRLRRGKGMVLDGTDHDSWSAGSFFTNPLVDPDLVPEGAPAFAQPDGRMKVSAAWLIDRAGFARGFGLPDSRAALSSKHTLALTNRGGAHAEEVLALARAVRDGVQAAYRIELEPEPQLVACGL